MIHVKSLVIIVERRSDSLYGYSIRIRTTCHKAKYLQGGLVYGLRFVERQQTAYALHGRNRKIIAQTR